MILMGSLVQNLLVFITVSVAVVHARRENAICRSTKLYFIGSYEFSLDLYCNCNNSSTNCSWSRFADPSVNIGIMELPSEAVLLWDRSIGYGQYICMGDNSIKENDVLILPGKTAFYSRTHVKGCG